MLKENKDIATKLKASRDQRKNINEDAHHTWPAYLRMLEDPKQREVIGRETELRKLAADKAVTRLAKWHKFEDGEVDQPFLNASTVQDDE